MNKKLVIICSAFALLLLLAIGFVFHRLFVAEDVEGEEIVSSDADLLTAVPSDAVMVYEFATLEEFRRLYFSPESSFSVMVNPKSELAKGIAMIPQEFDDASVLLSLHYSSKNTVSFLMVLSIEDKEERDALRGVMKEECEGVITKKYGGATIYKAVIPDVSYSFYNNFFIASTSHVTVESAIRHLDNNTSILDDKEFVAVAEHSNTKSALHVNNSNIGKFFSGAVNTKYLGYSKFVSSFATWSSFDIGSSDTKISAEGEFVSKKAEESFLNVFSSLKGGKSDLYEVIPFNTEFVVGIKVSDMKRYSSAYRSYLEANKKIKKGTNGVEWLDDVKVEEVAVASINLPDGYHRGVFIKVKDPANFKYDKGAVTEAFGKFFTPASADSVAFVKGWLVAGSPKLVEEISVSVQNELYFSLGMYLDQTPAAGSYNHGALVSGVVNLSRMSDSLSSYFKSQYSDAIINGIKENNFNLLHFYLDNEGGSPRPGFEIFSETLAILPQPPVADVQESDEIAVYDDLVVEVPKGPFEVKNFTNGKKNYLEQLPNNKLRMLDDKKKGVWTIPFETPLCGAVKQVDNFDNGKLQMVFCSGAKMYMLDRLGRWVRNYPVSLQKDVLLGPDVYDFNDSKEYTIVVLHQDNTIGMYDIKGVAVESWTPLVLSEKIKALPELHVSSGKRFWIVRTGYQTIILNQNGTPVADFTKKKRLRSDTEVERRSNSEVVVTTIEDKKVVLNLHTGNLKKL